MCGIVGEISFRILANTSWVDNAISSLKHRGPDSHGKWLSENYGADFHVVNAYIDSMHYPDRGNLAKEAGLPSKNIHVVKGYTDEAVAETAKKLNADLVIMGTLGQTGLVKTRRGNTAERVISALDVDVAVVNTEYES